MSLPKGHNDRLRFFVLRALAAALVTLLAVRVHAAEQVRCFWLSEPFDHVVTEMGSRENEARMYHALRVTLVNRRVNPRRFLPRLDVTRDARLLLFLPRHTVAMNCKEAVHLDEERFFIHSRLNEDTWKVRQFDFEIDVTRFGNHTRVVTRLDLSLDGLGKRLVQRWGAKMVLKDLETTIRDFTRPPIRWGICDLPPMGGRQ